MKKTLVFIAVLGSCLLSQSFAAPTVQNAIAQYNQTNLKIYDQLKAEVLQRTDPLIIVWSNRISFYRHHKLQEYPIVPVDYTDLKTLSHVSLAMFALFDPLNQFPKNISTVRAYQIQVKNILKTIDHLPLNEKQKQRQKAMLTKANDFIEQALNKKTVTPAELKQFGKFIFPLFYQNMTDATESQLVLVNQQMTKIQAQLTEEEKNKLFVVIPGMKLPREDNILVQFFEKYLNAPIDSSRLIYGEGLTDTKSVMELVANWKTDTLLAQFYFDNQDRMKKDLLADTASDYLQQCHRDPSGKQALLCK